MLALTKRTGYGLIAATHLARLGGGQVASAREIAESFCMSVSLLMNVLKAMAAAGYVESVRGARGGYRLARRPEEITLADLVAALEGPFRLAECVAPKSGKLKRTCQVMDRCPIIGPVRRVHQRFNDLLKKMTLAEMVAPGGSE